MDKIPKTKKQSDLTSILTNSWQIEILISGGACFVLFQLSEELVVLANRIGLNDYDINISQLVNNSMLGVRLLSVYFIIHLILRVVWLSFALLYKIFPQGINLERLNYPSYYQKLSTGFDLKKQTYYTDKISSMVFAWSVTFLLFYFGTNPFPILILYNILPRVISFFSGEPYQLIVNSVWYGYFIMLMGVSIFIFVIDTFLYGPLRRLKYIQKIYYPIYVFWNIFSLGFLWRPGFQVISSNIKSRWKTSLFAISGTLLIWYAVQNTFMLSSLIQNDTIEKTIVDGFRYLDRRTDEFDPKQGGTYIQSSIITEDYLNVFVYLNNSDNNALDSLDVENKYFSKIITLGIDDSLYTDLEWVGVNRVNNDVGIETVVDISHLEKKLHYLQVHRSYLQEPLVIPFWKQ